MDLKNKNILIAAQYAAPYEGNFIPSLKSLERQLKESFGAKCAFVFPKKMESLEWAEDFKREHKVYTTGNDKVVIKGEEADAIIKEFNPDLIYTHFEGYDLPFNKAIKKSKRNIRQVWHMHDTLSFHPNPLKALYQTYAFFKHYGAPMLPKFLGGGKLKSCVIAVSNHELRFIKRFRLGYKIKEQLIPNGIDETRIRRKENKNDGIFTFLAFGGRNIQKRIDLILKAAEILEKKGLNFKVIISKGTDTEEVVKFYYKDVIPEWLKLENQVEDINLLFEQADCFISSSIHETFSYAIAEASIFGLPVIQSDIEGTSWNLNNSSTFPFKSGNYIDLSNAMEKVMKENKETLLKNCEITRKNNLENFSLNSWTERVINFFMQTS